jgi:hypothetical protein
VVLAVRLARGLVSRIADPTNAVSAVVGSESLAKEAAPTKLMTASPRLFARHVVTVFHFLDALSTLPTLSDAPPVIEGLQQGHDHLVVFRSLFILCSGVAFAPFTTVRETGRFRSCSCSGST